MSPTVTHNRQEYPVAGVDVPEARIGSERDIIVGRTRNNGAGYDVVLPIIPGTRDSVITSGDLTADTVNPPFASVSAVAF